MTRTFSVLSDAQFDHGDGTPCFAGAELLTVNVRAFVTLVPALAACAPWMPPLDCATAADWSDPSMLHASRPGTTLRWPSVAITGDTFYVAANVFPSDTATALDRRPLTVLRSPGTSLGVPEGEFLFAFPKGVVDSRGAYHLIWAEPDSLIKDVRWWPSLRLRSLWYATYDGKTWSPPEKLLDAKRIVLNAEHGVFISDRRNGLHLVLPTTGSDMRRTLTYLRKTEGTWHVRQFATVAAYASILAWRSDSIVMAYTASGTTLSGRGNAVSVHISPDRGVTWDAPVFVSEPDARDAAITLLAKTPEKLHLVWARRDGTFNLTALVGRESRDGAEWTRMPDVQLPHGGMPIHLDAIDGAVTVIVEEFDGQRLSLREVTWRGARAQLRPLFGGFQHAGSAGFAGSSRTSVLVWSGNRNERERASTFSSTRTRAFGNRCRTHPP